MIRVAVWSPSKPLEHAIRELIARAGDTEMVGRFDGRPLPLAIRESGADVVVVDVDGSPTGAGELIGQILRSAPGVRILATSTHPDRRLVTRALDAGAVGYVLKECAFEDLPDAVRAVASNQCYLSPAIDDWKENCCRDSRSEESGQA